jgi:hypothetical protein
MKCNPSSLVSVALLLAFSMAANADPLPGRDVLKFSQRPMIATPLPGSTGGVETYRGHDELSTAWGVPNAVGTVERYEGTFMADDFADRLDSPVVHVKWWGSYIFRPTNLPPDQPAVRKFLISFENDVPAPPTEGFSHPGEIKFNQIVTLDTDGVLKPGEGTFTEHVVPGSTSTHGPTFEYNAELHLDRAFPELANTVYWLKIVALDEIGPNTPEDQRLRWGWHNRDFTIPDPLASRQPELIGPGPGEHNAGPLPGTNIPIWHFQDDAVTGNVAVVTNPESAYIPLRVEQPLASMQPTRYAPGIDGPSIIGEFSKDLAFQLFTVPEPGALMLAMLALAAASITARGKRG